MKFGSPLSEDLRAKFKRRSVRPRVGDSVRIVRGEFRNIEGKVTKVLPKKGKVNVEGVTREKIAGGTVPTPIDASKVVVTAFNLEDKLRKRKLEVPERMAKKGGRNRMKRLSAPKLWDLERKKKRFTFKPTPGPHSIAKSYPLGVLLRDLVGLVKTAGELRYAVNAGKVLVDGRVRRTPSFPVGLFDVVSIPSENLSLRLVPSPRGLLPSKIGKDEAEKKLCAVSSKVMVRGGRLRYGFHDGRSMAGDGLDLKPGDAVLMQVPEQRVLSEVRLAKESLGLVLSGERAGEVGRVLEVKKGTITRERMVKISLPSGEAEIPSRLVFPVGTDKPAITVSVSR